MAKSGSAVNTKKVDAEKLGARLRARREELGYKRAALAIDAGLTEEGVAKIERGKSYPSLTSFVAMCQALGMDLYDAAGIKPWTVRK